MAIKKKKLSAALIDNIDLIQDNMKPATEARNGLLSRYDRQFLFTGYGYTATSENPDKLENGIVYLNGFNSGGVFPASNGLCLKAQYMGSCLYIGYFSNKIMIRALRDGVDTGWKEIVTK